MLKGIAIVCVVSIHVSGLLDKTNVTVVLSNWFRWCVPLFLAISAYWLEKSWRKSPAQSLVRFLAVKLWRVLIPFVVWSVLYLLITVPPGQLTVNWIIARGFNGYAWAGQYYFLLLIQLMLIFPLLLRLRINSRSVFLVGLLTIGLAMFLPSWAARFSIIAKLNDRPIIYWLPYIFIGIFAARTDWARTSVWTTRKPGLILLGVPCLMVVEDIVWKQLGISTLSPYVRASVVGASLLWFTLGRQFLIKLQPAEGNLLSQLGRYSLGIFCLNPLFVYLIALLLGTFVNAQYLPASVQIFSALILVPLVLALAYGFSLILTKAKLSALVV
jgi:surface polysaccharide O-acyltransferase-like enzyme